MILAVPSQIVEYIDRRYPAAASGVTFFLTRDHAPTLGHLLNLVDALPPGLLTTTGDALDGFGEALEAVRTAVAAWRSGDNLHQLGKIPGRGKMNPLSIIRAYLTELRDDVVDAGTADLAFVTDAPFRETLRADIAAASRSFGVADWKGATVLAGSVVEALLLWAVLEHETRTPRSSAQAALSLVGSGALSKSPDPAVERWGLHELTEVAHTLGIIGPITAAQCRIAREFRNLIHPGRAARMGQQCNRGTTLSALAAVEHVIGDLG
jgi:hypothetical protein